MGVSSRYEPRLVQGDVLRMGSRGTAVSLTEAQRSRRPEGLNREGSRYAMIRGQDGRGASRRGLRAGSPTLRKASFPRAGTHDAAASSSPSRELLARPRPGAAPGSCQERMMRADAARHTWLGPASGEGTRRRSEVAGVAGRVPLARREFAASDVRPHSRAEGAPSSPTRPPSFVPFEPSWFDSSGLFSVPSARRARRPFGSAQGKQAAKAGVL